MTIVMPTRRPPMGIVAPQPRTLMANDLVAKQKLEIRPGEPVYMFIETRMGSGSSIAGLNKNGPFTVKPTNRPAGVAQPRTMGQWYEIAVKPGAKVGKTDQVKLETHAVVQHPQPSTGGVPFTLVVGAMRYY